MAKTVSIKCASRASVKVGDSFYTIEYVEERSIDKEDNIEKEREKLWDVCNNEVDNQIKDILNTFK